MASAIPTRRLQWIGLCVAAAASIALMVDYVWRGPVSSLDHPINDFMQRHNDAGFPGGTIGDLGAWLASVPGAILLTVFAVAFWWGRRLYRTAILGATSGLAVAAVIVMLKKFFHRRPPETPYMLQTASFPSGHTIAAVANLGVLIMLAAQVHLDSRKEAPGSAYARRTWRIAVAAWVTISVVVAAVRVVGQYHWFSDVVAGLAVGTVLLCATLLVARIPNGAPAGNDTPAVEAEENRPRPASRAKEEQSGG